MNRRRTMPEMPTTALMDYWRSMGLDARLFNLLKRHYYRAVWSQDGWSWSSDYPDSVEQFVSDLARPFDDSPLRLVRGVGKTVYQSLQDAIRR